MPPPADGSLIRKSRRIYVRPRTGLQSAHLWWLAVAKLQAARVPIAYSAQCVVVVLVVLFCRSLSCMMFMCYVLCVLYACILLCCLSGVINNNNNNNNNNNINSAIAPLAGPGGVRPPNAFLCNSQPKICKCFKSFTHVHKTPIHSVSRECCNKTQAYQCLISRCPNFHCNGKTF